MKAGYIEVPGGQGPTEEDTPQMEYTPTEPPEQLPAIPEEDETPPLPQEQPAPERQNTEPETEMIPATVPNTPAQAPAAAPTPHCSKRRTETWMP